MDNTFKLYEFYEYVKVLEAGASAERQETGLITSIKNAVRDAKGPIKMITQGITLNSVTDASKYTGRTSGGNEPLTDVVIYLDKKEVNVSMKGESAPSLAGGGFKGIEDIIPGLGKKFIEAVYDWAKKNVKPGEKMPDIYGRISEDVVLKLLQGNTSTGGPIHAIYVGPMTVNSVYKGNILKIEDGALMNIKDYAKKYEFFLRMRARREDQVFDPESKSKDGTPRIYSKSTKGDSSGRVVVANSTPKNATIIDF
jgi:hypothetical protein